MVENCAAVMPLVSAEFAVSRTLFSYGKVTGQKAIVYSMCFNVILHYAVIELLNWPETRACVYICFPLLRSADSICSGDLLLPYKHERERERESRFTNPAGRLVPSH